MSESSGENNGLPEYVPIPFPYRLGAIHRPAPAAVPPIRARLALDGLSLPNAVTYHEFLDLTDEDGQPDALLNDRIGCCVPAAAWRLCQLWTNLTGDHRKPRDEQIAATYSAWAGYDPARPETDRGTPTDDGFAAFGAKGLRWSDQTLIVPRWLTIQRAGQPPDIYAFRAAIHMLGGVLVTFDMPRSVLDLTVTAWTDPQPGADGTESAGAHEVLLAGYDDRWFYAVSWGRVFPVSYGFLRARTLAASAFVSFSWLRPSGISPPGLNWDQLRADAARIAV